MNAQQRCRNFSDMDVEAKAYNENFERCDDAAKNCQFEIKIAKNAIVCDQEEVQIEGLMGSQEILKA